MASRPTDEAGFTLVELVVAITMLALTLLSISYGMYAGMNTLQVARHKTSFLELANAEVEKLRSLAYDDAGVNAQPSPGTTDPDLTAAYPSNQFEGHDAVLLNPSRAKALPAVTTETTSDTPGLVAPYTIRRWVTWTDAAGGTTHDFKRLAVKVEWTERGRAQNVRYSSLYYPGDLGPPQPKAGDLPIAAFVVCPASTCFGSPSVPALGKATITGFSVNSTSSDPNGLPLTYGWNWGDGTTATGINPGVHTYVAIGAYTITLTVQNNATPQGFATTSRDVLVGTSKPNPPALLVPTNGAPTASMTTNYTAACPTCDPVVPTPTAPLRITANAQASTDPDGDPLIYTFDWNDGTITSGVAAAPTHTYASGGAYTITLVVSDPGGLSSTPVSGPLILIGTTGCAVSTTPGDNYFQNPPGNATRNRINIRGNGVIRNENFFIEIQTNAYCTGLTLSIPKNGGAFLTTFSGPTTVGNVRIWRSTTACLPVDRYFSGTQSATISATGPSNSASQVLTFSAG